jgi:hypothetical protein
MIVNWNRLAVAAEMGIKAGLACTMCSKVVTDFVFHPSDFEELKCLLLERESALGIKFTDVNTKDFFICEDCKCRVDEELKSNTVHIMYCE